MRRWLLLAVLASAVLGVGTVAAQNLGTDPSAAIFRVSWNATTTRRGQPAVEGYVTNQTGNSYRGIQIAIDGADADGRPLPTTLAWVNGEVSPEDRLYFKTVVPAGKDYRVAVRSWERFGGGAGGM